MGEQEQSFIRDLEKINPKLASDIVREWNACKKCVEELGKENKLNGGKK